MPDVTSCFLCDLWVCDLTFSVSDFHESSRLGLFTKITWKVREICSIPRIRSAPLRFGKTGPLRGLCTTSQASKNRPVTSDNTLSNYRIFALKTPLTFPCNYRAPVTTATSIVSFVFDRGVIIAGDLLGSYGSLARFRNCPRVLKVNDNAILGAGGDYADFQYVKDLIEQKMLVFHTIIYCTTDIFYGYLSIF